MAGIDIIRNQIMPGGGEVFRKDISVHDSEFYHYVLSKMGSSSAAIEANKRGKNHV